MVHKKSVKNMEAQSPQKGSPKKGTWANTSASKQQWEQKLSADTEKKVQKFAEKGACQGMELMHMLATPGKSESFGQKQPGAKADFLRSEAVAQQMQPSSGYEQALAPRHDESPMISAREQNRPDCEQPNSQEVAKQRGRELLNMLSDHKPPCALGELERPLHQQPEQHHQQQPQQQQLLQPPSQPPRFNSDFGARQDVGFGMNRSISLGSAMLARNGTQPVRPQQQLLSTAPASKPETQFLASHPLLPGCPPMPFNRFMPPNMLPGALAGLPLAMPPGPLAGTMPGMVPATMPQGPFAGMPPLPFAGMPQGMPPLPLAGMPSLQLAGMPPLPLAGMPPAMQQGPLVGMPSMLGCKPPALGSQPPPPCFTPRLLPQQSFEPPPSCTPRLPTDACTSQWLRGWHATDGSVLATGGSMSAAPGGPGHAIERRTSMPNLPIPSPASPLALEPDQQPCPLSARVAVACVDTVIDSTLDDLRHHASSPEKVAEAEPTDADGYLLETDETEQAEDRLGGLMTRSNSECSLNSSDSDEELDHFVPQHCMQSMEWPLSQHEKRQYYTKLCDQERTAAVLQYRDLKRRTMDGKRASVASNHSLGESENCEDPEELKLLEKQRELERQLQDVRSERRRLTRSKP